MADNKKYYYLKLVDNFYNRDEMIMLESMPDGFMYSNILLKLYLRSLKTEGKLLFNGRIPYNSTMLSNVVRHPVAVVEKSLLIFKDLGLIEVLDNGAIYLTDIQNFIGESSTEADRKREYRKRIETDKMLLLGQMSDECPDKNPPEIEIELEIEKEIELEIELQPEKETVVGSKNEEKEPLAEPEPKKKPKRKSTEKKIDHQSVIDTYNSICSSLPTALKLTPKRKTLIETALSNYGEEKVVQAFQTAQESRFLKGETEANFTPGFDWIMNETNMTKILEGNYKNKEDNGKPSTATPKKQNRFVNFKQRDDFDFDAIEEFERNEE